MELNNIKKIINHKVKTHHKWTKNEFWTCICGESYYPTIMEIENPNKYSEFPKWLKKHKESK